MKLKRIFALILALVLSALTGCSGSNARIAATYNGGEVPAGIYIANLLSAENEASYQIPDPSKPLLKQEIDGKKASDWIKERAQEYTKRFAAVESECTRLGITLDETVSTSIVSSIAQSWETQGTIYQQNGVSQASLAMLSQSSNKSALLLQKIYGEGGEKAVGEDELKSYYMQNYRRVLFLLIPKVDEASGAMLEGDPLKEREALIDAYYSRAQNGEKLFDLMNEYEKTKPTPTTLVESQQEAVISKTTTSYPASFLTAVFAQDAALGTVERYEDETGRYTILFDRRDLMGDGSQYAMAKASLLSEMKREEFLADLLKIADSSIDFVFNDNAVRRYTPSKLKLK
ncbi:MAG: hypothetical protein RR135_04355 [Oscillospiraceae bacterium]